MENMNRPIMIKEIKSVIKNLPTKKSPGPNSLTGEFYETFEELTSSLLKLFQKIEKGITLLNSLYKASITLIPKPDKDTIRKENYRLISLINIDAKVLNKTIENQIHSTLKGSYIMIKWDSPLGHINGSTYANQ